MCYAIVKYAFDETFQGYFAWAWLIIRITVNNEGTILMGWSRAISWSSSQVPAKHFGKVIGSPKWFPLGCVLTPDAAEVMRMWEAPWDAGHWMGAWFGNYPNCSNKVNVVISRTWPPTMTKRPFIQKKKNNGNKALHQNGPLLTPTGRNLNKTRAPPSLAAWQETQPCSLFMTDVMCCDAAGVPAQRGCNLNFGTHEIWIVVQGGEDLM